MLEGFGVADGGHERIGRQWPNAGDLLQLATALITPVPLANLLLQFADLSIQFVDVPSEASKEVPHGS
jgi:hypothetical protein